jgi:hypothetical protein
MVQTADELHQEYIRNHQQAHLESGHLALDVLQLRYPDLSCPIAITLVEQVLVHLLEDFGPFTTFATQLYFILEGPKTLLLHLLALPIVLTLV